MVSFPSPPVSVSPVFSPPVMVSFPAPPLMVTPTGVSDGSMAAWSSRSPRVRLTALTPITGQVAVLAVTAAQGPVGVIVEPGSVTV